MTNSDLEHTILIFQLFFFSILFCMCAVELPILISNIYPDFEHLSWFQTSILETASFDLEQRIQILNHPSLA